MIHHFAVICLAAVLLLIPVVAESPTVPGRDEPQTRDVRIEQDLVRVRITNLIRSTPDVMRPRTAVARADRPAASDANKESRRTGMLMRTARALAGDGRFRPEPFPRPTR